MRAFSRTLFFPAFAPRASVSRGAATFTMLLFLLLLISSGLMYFYFQRCLALEREVALWKKGVKVRDEKLAIKPGKSFSTSAVELGDKILGMPAPSTAVDSSGPKSPASSKASDTLSPIKTPAPTPKPLVAKKDDSAAESLRKKSAAQQSGASSSGDTPTPKTTAKADASHSASKGAAGVHSAYDLPDSTEKKTPKVQAAAESDDEPVIHVKSPRRPSKSAPGDSEDATHDSANPVKPRNQGTDE